MITISIICIIYIYILIGIFMIIHGCDECGKLKLDYMPIVEERLGNYNYPATFDNLQRD